MASSYNRKSDSSASRAQRRATAAGKRTPASASSSCKSVRKDADRGQGGVSAKSSSSRHSRGSMDDAAIAAAAAAAMSGGSGASSADSSVVEFPTGASSSRTRSASSTGVVAGSVSSRRPRAATPSTRVSSVRSAAGEPSSSVRRERGSASSAASGEHPRTLARHHAEDGSEGSSADGRSSRSSRSSRRSVASGGSQEVKSSRRSAHHDGPAGEEPAANSSRRHTSRADEDAAIGSKKRKSIRDKANKGKRKSKDAAPAGTDDLSTSDSARRRRNRDVDEVAAEGGRRVGDIRASRAAERAARARKRYLSYVLKLAAVVATVLVVVFGSIFIYRSNLLAITTVTVSGAEHLTDQEVTQLAAVPDDSTLLRLDTAGICSRLEEHPWVKSAQISRQFPNSIKIQITERTPSAVVKISKKSIWVISTDGAWLSSATKDDWKSYRRIVDADATMSAPVAGSECTNEGVLNALKIYDGVSSELAEQIASISAESAVKTSLTLKDGVTVAFGEAENIELKEADIFALLEQYSGTISYINVRVPDRPTYRTAKQ